LVELVLASITAFSIADLRSLARDPKKKEELKSPEKILETPLTLESCLQVLNENYDVMKDCLGEDDHKNTMNSLNLIHSRFQRHNQLSSAGTKNKLLNFFPAASLVHSNRNVEVEKLSPMLTYVGDEKSDVDMVYAVGIDPLKKRVTVAFRGSVTVTDFQKDAMISLNHQPNPVKNIDPNQREKIGIHHGFYDYLLRPRKDGKNKYQEIMDHVEALFLECGRRKDYKLYVTGHSLGGALATLFSLHAAASAGSRDGIIPQPVSCISVASPRVGDRGFQVAFCRLEEFGLLRHLRIANDRDPVTMMPSATSKKVWTRLSPISYIAYKLADNKFDENEHFFHTGVKLRLAKDRWELCYLGATISSDATEEALHDDTDSASCSSSGSNKKNLWSSWKSNKPKSRGSIRQDSFNQSQLPDVNFHLGNAYIENLCSVKEDLVGISLNDLYFEKASSIFLDKFLEK